MPWLLVVLVAAVGTGIFLPLLGISLAAFLLVDLAIGLYRGRTSGLGGGVEGEEQRDAGVLVG